MDLDTITSISTPMGEGAIGIVRLSGPQAVEIADKLYKGKHLLKTTFHHIRLITVILLIQSLKKWLKKLW